jgi:UDP-N-acetylglucosamine acyltransferase
MKQPSQRLPKGDVRPVVIHPTAIVAPEAQLGEGVEVGPYSIIGPHVGIGDGTVLGPHVFLQGRTTIGRDCQLSYGVVLGGEPQDDKYQGEPTEVIIGDRNRIREYVTIHRATGEGQATRVGSDNLLMAYSHLGHNCEVGNSVMLASYAGMSGHTIIEDRVVIGGMVGSHQKVRVGTLAMVSGYSKLVADVPPYMVADGRPARVYGLNVVGLRRAGFSPAVRRSLQIAYKLLYRSNLNLSQALERWPSEVPDGEEVRYLFSFLERMRTASACRSGAMH